MSIKQVTECDVCGVHKKEANHWLVMWIDSDGMLVINRNSMPFGGDRSNLKYKDVCGREHALTLFSRFMQTGQLELEVELKI